MYKKSIKNFLKRIFLSLMVFILLCYLIDNSVKAHEIILKNNIDFSYIRSKTRKLLGIPLIKKDLYVTSEKIKYYNIEEYKNGYKLTVDNNYIIKSLSDGVVIFIGNIEGLNKTVKVESSDGLIISYGYLENISVNMYDYIDKNKILGSAENNTLYISFEKNKEYLNYEEYL